MNGMAVNSNKLSLKVALAWAVHFITATGAVWGLLALIAVSQHQWQLAFLWMAIATLVDSVDGALARLLHVKRLLPHFDGALLDNMVDYLTYVIVPAYFLYEAGLLPAALALPGAILVVLTSAYQFCQGDAKTTDHFFKGFPSYWNILVLYLFLLNLNPWVNLLLVVFCGIMVFVPIKYIYPSRTTRFQRLTLALTILWGATLLLAVLQYPLAPPWLVWASLLYILYYFGLSLYLTKQ